jgi:peptidyl-prolyl cis-trans isomerase B (cyclophilin B)
MRIILTIITILSVLSGISSAIEYKNPKVVIETDKMNIVLEVYLLDTPIAAGNFLMLVKKGFYDGLIFHRVEPNYVVQGGDPEGTGYGGPGYTIPDEPSPYKHLRGSVGMAKTPEPNSAGSQFYICLEDLPKLDGKYTIFAKVIEGMDVVDRIAIGDKMKRVYIQEEK